MEGGTPYRLLEDVAGLLSAGDICLPVGHETGCQRTDVGAANQSGNKYVEQASLPVRKDFPCDVLERCAWAVFYPDIVVISECGRFLGVCFRGLFGKPFAILRRLIY